MNRIINSNYDTVIVFASYVGDTTSYTYGQSFDEVIEYWI